MSNSACPGSCAGGPSRTYLPDDLAGGHGDGQVDVAQGDVVGEALQQPQRHGADRRVRGDVHRLVAHHHLRSAGLEVAEHLRVDEDVDRRVGRERAVGGRGDRRDRVVLPRVAVQGAVEGGDASAAPRPPAAASSAAAPPGRPAPPPAPAPRTGRPRARPRPTRTSVSASRRTSSGVVIHSGERRSPPPTEVTTTRSPSTRNPNRTSDMRRGRVEAAERPGGVDRGLPGAVLGDARPARRRTAGRSRRPGRRGVLDQGDQLVAGRAVVGVGEAPAPLGRLPSATASSRR